MVETHDLPTPSILQKEANLVYTHDLPENGQKKGRSYTWPPGWFKHMIYLAPF